MSLLEKAQQHYRTKLAAEPEELYVPQWDAKVYIKPAVNLAQMGEIMELSREGKGAEAMVMTLIHRLVDDEGKPVFRKIEKTEILRSVDPDVLSFILSKINAGDPDEDEIEKN